MTFRLQLSQDFSGELIVPRSSALVARSNRGRVREGSKNSMGSLRSALLSASLNSRALEKRCQGCFAIPLCTTRPTD